MTTTTPGKRVNLSKEFHLRAGHRANGLVVNRTLPGCFISNLYYTVVVPFPISLRLTVF